MTWRKAVKCWRKSIQWSHLRGWEIYNQVNVSASLHAPQFTLLGSLKDNILNCTLPQKFERQRPFCPASLQP